MLLGMMLSTMVMAQHSIYVSTSVAGNTVIPLQTLKDSKGAIGVQPQIGLGYHLRHQHFLMNIGVEAAYRYQWQYLTDADAPSDAIDSEGEPYIRHERRIDRVASNRDLLIHVPVLFGGQFNNAYFFVGPVYSIRCAGWSKENGVISITGTPAYYLGEYHDMPEHGFMTGEKYTTDDQRMATMSDVLLHVEAGARLLPYEDAEISAFSKPFALYLGAYAEYGFLHMSDGWADFNLGVRLRMVFNLPKPHHCICYED